MRQAATAQPMPTIPEMRAAWAYAGDMFVKAADGNADPAETVRETAALIDEANSK
jgi:maltose-binding protein MalE